VANVVFDAVGKVYPDGTRAVTALDLEVADGEFLVLVGPSGCGKTTALRMLAGLEEISEGEIRIGDRVVNDVPSRDRDVAMVFQSYALYPHLSVRDNIAFGLKLRRTPKAELDKRVHSAAEVLGLGELLDRKPRNLSGGQRQRVAMGRAIVREPQAFLMDEPLSNLDAKLRVQMRAEIARLQRDLDVTTIYVTHDQTEAMTLGDRVAVMKRGVLQQVDEPQQLYDRPLNLFVAGFIGSPAMNMFQGRLEHRGDEIVLHVGSQELAVAPALLTHRPEVRRRIGDNLIFGIRPEDMEDAALGPRRPGSTLKATADLVESMGSDVLVHLSVDAPPVVTDDTKELAEDAGTHDLAPTEVLNRALFVARFSPRTTVREGEAVELVVDTERLHVFDPATGTALWD
jgi:multiple sugar transport system ATP-binding protein